MHFNEVGVTPFLQCSYLGAFCSPECRDAQIAIDKAGQEVRGQSIGTKT